MQNIKSVKKETNKMKIFKSDASKEIKNNIIKRICQTFLEFLKFVEANYVTEIEKNITQLTSEEKLLAEFSESIEKKNEIINSNVFKFKQNSNLNLFLFIH